MIGYLLLLAYNMLIHEYNTIVWYKQINHTIINIVLLNINCLDIFDFRTIDDSADITELSEKSISPYNNLTDM